jgi:membrane-associated phospholipid phosphatase
LRLPLQHLSAMVRLGVPLVLVVVLSTGTARADPGALRVDLRRDLALTAAAAAAAFGIDSLGFSSRCVICSAGGLDHEARELLRLEGLDAMGDARRASDQLVSLIMPAGALAASAIPALRDGAPRELLEDAVIVLEATLIAADLNALVKGTVGRSRPGDVTAETRSFYSSHTSRAFALAVSTATVATIRGRRSARWLWIAGLTLSTGVGYLRLASDSHWLTDVATGAVVGSAVGFSVPWYLHRGRPLRRFDVTPAPGGLAVAF